VAVRLRADLAPKYQETRPPMPNPPERLLAVQK